MIEKITQWNLVKYIGSLINPTNLDKRIDKIMELYQNNTLGQVAIRLFIWSIVIILVSTIIDQIFYWSRPEQRIRLMKFIEYVKEYKKILFNKLNNVFRKQKG